MAMGQSCERDFIQPGLTDFSHASFLPPSISQLSAKFDSLAAAAMVPVAAADAASYQQPHLHRYLTAVLSAALAKQSHSSSHALCRNANDRPHMSYPPGLPETRLTDPQRGKH